MNPSIGTKFNLDTVMDGRLELTQAADAAGSPLLCVTIKTDTWGGKPEGRATVHFSEDDFEALKVLAGQCFAGQYFDYRRPVTPEMDAREIGDRLKKAGLSTESIDRAVKALLP